MSPRQTKWMEGQLLHIHIAPTASAAMEEVAEATLVARRGRVRLQKVPGRVLAHPEFRCALKAGKEASDDRVERSLYQLAIGWNGQPPNVTACIFWLKNRRKDRWRDVQGVEGEIGHYIISDRPMTEQEWIEQRATLAPKQIDVTPAQHAPDSQANTET